MNLRTDAHKAETKNLFSSWTALLTEKVNPIFFIIIISIVNSKHLFIINYLLMTGCELQTSGVGSNHSAN